ncbi:hypothetical protein GGR01_001390 [Acetobacter oeni]|nr:hypothetical protein [Acetobacter oeni]
MNDQILLATAASGAGSSDATGDHLHFCGNRLSRQTLFFT